MSLLSFLPVSDSRESTTRRGRRPLWAEGQGSSIGGGFTSSPAVASHLCPKTEKALIQSFPCHLPVRTRPQQRPKEEAAKQRASEQPIFTHLTFARACMKIWCSQNRNPANRWSESCPLWSGFPVAPVTKIFLEKFSNNQTVVDF
jgi:hypothetical protein